MAIIIAVVILSYQTIEKASANLVDLLCNE
jgi:hypothetical protein